MNAAANNKLGNVLGRKGNERRRALIEAAKRLLKEKHSPFTLTAIGIAKEANTAGATFYVYFTDVEDIVYSIGQETVAELEAITMPADAFTNRARFDDDSARLIDQFNAIWDRNSDMFLYCTLEADRGNERFLELRVTMSVPLLNILSDLIMAAAPEGQKPTRTQSYAEAVILYAAMDRTAATRFQYCKPGLSHKDMREAQIRVFSRLLGQC